MLTSERRGGMLCGLVGLLVIVISVPAGAFPVTLPSGKVIDLNSEQLELLKQSPGIYYIEHQPERLINEEVQYWTVIELPRGLGGGFIIANPQNLAQGLERLNAREIPDRGTTDTKSTPKGSDSEAEIKPVGTKDLPLQNDWRLTLDIGYRVDDIDWSIAGLTPDIFLPLPLQNNFVNILSELTWRDLEIFQLECSLEKRIQRKYRIKGVFAYGVIFDGDNQDSDYAGNDRTLEFSRSIASTDDGSTSDVSVSFGRSVFFLSDLIELTPFIGFSHHSQNLIITDGVQVVSNLGWPTPLGPFSGLDSSYDASWFGPWAGLELTMRIYKRESRSPLHEFLLGGEYHCIDYDAEADWNLRADLAHPVSFEHEANGSGYVLYGRWNYFFSSHWSLSLSGKYQEWETDSGTDEIFGALGGSAKTPLNEVNWESWSALVGLTCRF